METSTFAFYEAGAALFFRISKGATTKSVSKNQMENELNVIKLKKYFPSKISCHHCTNNRSQKFLVDKNRFSYNFYCSSGPKITSCMAQQSLSLNTSDLSFIFIFLFYPTLISFILNVYCVLALQKAQRD